MSHGLLSLWKKLYVWITIIGVNSQMFQMASVSGWTSSAIPKLKSEQVYLNIIEENNLNNMLLIGTVIGSLMSFFFLSYLGRKVSQIIIQIIALVSWLLLFFKYQTTLLYVGRFLGGVSFSSVGLVLPMYEAETFHPKDRQISGAFMNMYVALGLMLDFSLAPFISYNCAVMINLIPAISFLLVFPLFGKETPYHLAKKEQYEESAKVLRFFWCHDSSEEEIQTEIHNIKKIVDEKRGLTTLSIFKSILTDSLNFKACVLSLILIIFFNTCGSYQILMYLEPILIRANVTEISASVSSAIVGGVKPVGAVLSLPLIHWLGVKVALIYTLVGSAVPLICLGIFFFLQYQDLSTQAIFWLPLTSAAIFCFSLLLGAGILPYIIRGEILPNHLRGPGGASTDIISGIFAVIINYYYDAFEDKLFVSFWTFAVITIANIIFVIWYIPETKDRSLLEIQNAIKNTKINFK